MGGFKGRGAFAFFLSGIRPFADPKEILATDPKIVLRAPSAPINTNLNTNARQKKRFFHVEIFQKMPKMAFLTGFFLKKIWPKQRLFSTLGELR